MELYSYSVYVTCYLLPAIFQFHGMTSNMISVWRETNYAEWENLHSFWEMTNLWDLPHDHEKTSFTAILCHSFGCPGTVLQSTHSKHYVKAVRNLGSLQWVVEKILYLTCIDSAFQTSEFVTVF